MAEVDNELRSVPRIRPFVVPCRIHLEHARLSGYLTDLSPKGARVSCDDGLPARGRSVVIEVRFGGRATFSRLAARVMWVRRTDGGGEAGVCGLSFEGLGAEDKVTLDAVVGEFKRRAALLG
jgi:hypothetical protein